MKYMLLYLCAFLILNNVLSIPVKLLKRSANDDTGIAGEAGSIQADAPIEDGNAVKENLPSLKERNVRAIKNVLGRGLGGLGGGFSGKIGRGFSRGLGGGLGGGFGGLGGGFG